MPKPSTGQALVEVRYSGVCGTQIGEVNGSRGPDPWIPHCLGHEGTGVVLEVGPEVTQVATGDEVVMSWIQGAGIATGGATYGSALGLVNSGPVATLMRHAVIGETRLTRLPHGLSLREAVALGCPAPTGLGAVRKVLGCAKGQSLVVFGAGGVGLFAILAGVSCEAYPIACVDPKAPRRQLALDWGATHALNPTDAGSGEQLQELVGGSTDAIVVATGHPEALLHSLNLLKPQGGQVVVVGNAPHGSEVRIDLALFNQGKSIRGTWGGDAKPAEDFPWMAQIIADSATRVARLYSEAYSLENTNAAFDAMSSGKVGRALIDMNMV
ncbi:zinc-binding dehydrogenase [Candidatus Nanopelagicales bacterium]|nr:zinc-binding dehydrogenase [Candidatus Nanopelagicales bacterium]